MRSVRKEPSQLPGPAAEVVIPEPARPARTNLLIATMDRMPPMLPGMGRPGAYLLRCPSRRRGAGTGAGRELAGGTAPAGELRPAP